MQCNYTHFITFEAFWKYNLHSVKKKCLSQKMHRNGDAEYFITVRHCACVGREEGYLFKEGQVVAASLCVRLA